MTTIARRVRSTPVRTATETWEAIVGMFANPETSLCDTLAAVGNTAAMLIAEEHTCGSPIVLTGCGPQVRIYTLHGPAAIDGANENEQSISVTPSDGWQLRLPASGDDVRFAYEAVRGVDHVEVYDADTDNQSDPAPTQAAASRPIAVDLSALES